MANGHDVFLIAGQSGSKSTFVGGLRHHGVKQDKISLSDIPIQGDTDGDYYERVVKQMSTNRKYPKQTENGYVLKLELSYESQFASDISFNFIDIPGEQIDTVLSSVQQDIRNDNIDEDAIEEQFEQVESKIDGPEQIELGEWKTIFKYYYTQATKVVFLVNLHKIIIEDEMPTYDNALVKKVAEEKVKVAVVPTAVDLFNYDPDEDPEWESRGLLNEFSARDFDENLSETIDEKMSPGSAPKMTGIMSELENNHDIDFFSVSVPAADPGNPDSNDLEPGEDGGFETKGYEVLLEWLQK